jgi:hypothetical protein
VWEADPRRDPARPLQRAVRPLRAPQTQISTNNFFRRWGSSRQTWPRLRRRRSCTMRTPPKLLLSPVWPGLPGCAAHAGRTARSAPHGPSAPISPVLQTAQPEHNPLRPTCAAAPACRLARSNPAGAAASLTLLAQSVLHQRHSARPPVLSGWARGRAHAVSANGPTLPA